MEKVSSDKADPAVKDGPGKAPAPEDTQATPSSEKITGKPQNEPAKPEPTDEAAKV